MSADNDRAFKAKVSKPDGFNQAGYIDIHCHCLSGIDDGPATIEQSLALCRQLVADGVAGVIATPHQLGRFSDCNEARQIRQKVSELNERLEAEGIELFVSPGADVRVDERICQLIEADRVLTLADNKKYVLLEFPHDVFIDIEPLLVDLLSMGIKAVISHPERHPVLSKRPGVLAKWLEYGAHLQITAGSLVGQFGATVQKNAWWFLDSGWTGLVATDAHNLEGRKPVMNAVFEGIARRQGRDAACLVCIENPRRVLEGRDVEMFVSLATGKCSDGTGASGNRR